MHKKKTTNLNTFSKGIPAMNIKTQNHRKSPQESQTYWIVYGVNTQINKYKNLHLYIYIYIYIISYSTSQPLHWITWIHSFNIPSTPSLRSLRPWHWRPLAATLGSMCDFLGVLSWKPIQSRPWGNPKSHRVFAWLFWIYLQTTSSSPTCFVFVGCFLASSKTSFLFQNSKLKPNKKHGRGTPRVPRRWWFCASRS